MEKFWILYVEGTQVGHPILHYSREEAYTEARRLARLANVRGEKVYILEAIAYYQVEPVLAPIGYHLIP